MAPKVGFALFGGMDAGLIQRGFSVWREIGPILRVDGVACPYTFPYALRWVLRQWASASIDVFGVDMDEGDGLNPWGSDNYRNGLRWDLERMFIGAVNDPSRTDFIQ